MKYRRERAAMVALEWAFGKLEHTGNGCFSSASLKRVNRALHTWERMDVGWDDFPPNGQRLVERALLLRREVFRYNPDGSVKEPLDVALEEIDRILA